MLRATPQNILAFEVIGDSMEPRLKSGDRVFVDRRLTYPNPEGIFVLWDGYSIVVKQLQIIRGTDPLKLRVISANLQYEPYEVLADEVNIVGRFVGRFTTE
jgi:phage repressor protein C with HTH and peptisase S24 domain